MRFVLFQQVRSTIFRRLVRLRGRLADLLWRNLCNSILLIFLEFFAHVADANEMWAKAPSVVWSRNWPCFNLHSFWIGFKVLHFPQGKGMPQMYGPALTSACVLLQRDAPWSGWCLHLSLRGGEPRVCQQFVGRPNLWTGTHHTGHRTW